MDTGHYRCPEPGCGYVTHSGAVVDAGFNARVSEHVASHRIVYETSQAECDHPRDRWRYLRTREDWYDGDEDDIYICERCGKQIEIYIPR